MMLAPYFCNDDGSLPEIEIAFDEPAQLVAAFRHLFAQGAINNTAELVTAWDVSNQRDRAFSGPEYAALVVTGRIEPFHIVLSGVYGTKTQIPDLGVFVFPSELVIDYRMGKEWGDPQIRSFLDLLRNLRGLGGKISSSWWGSEGEQEILNAMDES